MSIQFPLVTIIIVVGVGVGVGVVNGQSVSTLVSSSPSTTFEESYSAIWGRPESDGSVVNLKLDRGSGSGVKSIHAYSYGFFSALIKLPAQYSAGVVTAFYLSNSDNFPHNHDELDFEFLGVSDGSPYTLQTNVYGDGSTEGREERIKLWFDAAADFHRYSILWNSYQLVFFVDDVPIRHTTRSNALGDRFPSKPMRTYFSIWDGSNWATDGGRSPVEYGYSPFVASFADLKLLGCQDNEFCTDQQNNEVSNVQGLTEQQYNDMVWVRSNYLTYTYCNDIRRYPTPLPEC